MALKGGVGSAVMSGSKIVGQAPFVPVKAGFASVAAPLLAFQCLTTMTMLGEFADIKQGMATIQQDLVDLMERHEAIFVGEVKSAQHRLERLEQEFDIGNRFTTDMVIRLALLEDSINPIFERHSHLYFNVKIDEKLEKKRWDVKQWDAHMAISLSLLDLRLDILRVKLALQDNPGFIQFFADNLVKKIDRYRELWVDIEASSQKTEDAANKLKAMTEDMSWWGRTMPSFLFGDRDARVAREAQALDLKDGLTVDRTLGAVDGARSAKNAGEELRSKLSGEKAVNLFYWKDEAGEHSYYTSDVCIR